MTDTSYLSNDSGNDDDVRSNSASGVRPARRKRKSLSAGKKRARTPSQIGPYHVGKLLGKGGFGRVFRCTDPRNPSRELAVKIPLKKRQSKACVDRLMEEAERAKHLQHDRIVKVIEAERDRKFGCYIVMELVQGRTLAATLAKRGRMSLKRVTEFVAELADALHYLHEQGFVHRDLSLGNIMVDAEGRPVIIDFGLMVVDGECLPPELAGTLPYMAPEQTRGERYFNTKTDIWGLGVVLYQLLGAELPFQAESNTDESLIQRIRESRPKALPLKGDATAELEAVCLRCLRKEPDDRYSTASDVACELRSAFVSPLKTSGVSLAALHRQEQEMAFINDMVARIQEKAGDRRDTIPVGLLHSMTGSLAVSETPLVKAELMAMEEINAQGGLFGKKLFPVVTDGESNMISFRKGAEDLVKQTKFSADVIFGCWSSASRLVVTEVVKEHNSLLVYAIAYEGLQEPDYTMCTGALPNQDIQPGLDFCIRHLGREGEACRIYYVGSDYVFPRAALTMVEKWIGDRGQVLIDHSFLPFYSSLNDTEASEDKVKTVVKRIKEEQPDVILNFINGSLNQTFSEELYEQGVSRHTPTLCFSVGESELVQMPAPVVDGMYVVGSYFEPAEIADGDSFAKRYKKRFNPSEITSEEMWNAYAGVKLWAEGVLAAESTRAEDVRAAIRRLTPEQATVRIGDDTLELDPKSRHAIKRPMVGQVRASDRGLLIRPVEEFDGAPIRPKLYPDDGDPCEWQAFARSLWFACDVIPTLDIPHTDEFRRSFLRSIAAPYRRSMAFVDLARSGEGGFHRYLDDYRKLGIMGLAHNLQDLEWSARRDGVRFQQLAKDGLLDMRKRIHCSDSDVKELFQGELDADQLALATAKAKAFAYRGRKAYLFDMLHFSMETLQQDVVINDEPATGLASFSDLFHEDLYFDLSDDWNWQLFESLQWHLHGNALERRIQHRVDVISSSNVGSRAANVIYTLVAVGDMRTHKNSLDKLQDGGSGDTSRLFRSMTTMFDDPDDEQLTIKKRAFDSLRWQESQATGVFVFDWKESRDKKELRNKEESRNKEQRYGLTLAGRQEWTNLQWPA